MSAQSGETPTPIRFGVFEFDVLSSELRRDGVRVTIGEQPPSECCSHCLNGLASS